eukprot:TRINITY_DN8413_c1_g2_i1.p1 TRINITY_DN8413_c1_g2~~TRINITY_DN8413_c1_g2_i1.p1  ORF type:complete len:289 (+),score=80.56 TRINITY_DN8413_c1_g2_i1:40-906(+)
MQNVCQLCVIHFSGNLPCELEAVRQAGAKTRNRQRVVSQHRVIRVLLLSLCSLWSPYTFEALETFVANHPLRGESARPLRCRTCLSAKKKKAVDHEREAKRQAAALIREQAKAENLDSFIHSQAALKAMEKARQKRLAAENGAGVKEKAPSAPMRSRASENEKAPKKKKKNKKKAVDDEREAKRQAAALIREQAMEKARQKRLAAENGAGVKEKAPSALMRSRASENEKAPKKKKKNKKKAVDDEREAKRQAAALIREQAKAENLDSFIHSQAALKATHGHQFVLPCK